jgi:FMN-dependent oxidoreductase (nitrilotriacetate monooxygenase family)
MHLPNHRGKYFTVKGPLNSSRPPQGHPIIIQAGSSEPGQELAARTADIVFTAQQTIEEAQAFYTSVKDRLPAFGRRRDSVKIMPGIFTVIGRTRQEARDKFDEMQQWIDPASAFGLLSQRLGHDVSKFELDAPLPDLPASEQLQSRSRLLREMAAREKLTLRQLLNIVAGARGHRILIGTAEDIADSMEEWFQTEAADGFNVMPPYFPGPLKDFVDLVVPILQGRNLFRSDYEGSTLRENLGLERPASRYAV